MRLSEAASNVPIILQWAHFYADLGFSIIPTAPGKKQPGVVWEPFQERRPTKAELTTWLTGLYSSSGIGLVTGEISGNVFVVDADASEGKNGTENLDDLLMMHEDFPITWSARSGGGGVHYFFRAPPGVIIKTSKNDLAQWVDVRGEGGFLVLPPSPHPCGQIYKWIDGVDPATTVIADAPEWLLRLVREDAYSLRFDAPEFRRSYATPAPEPRQSEAGPALTLGSRPDYPGSGYGPDRGSPAPGDFNAFGRRIDGREEYMRDLVWARLIEARREAPLPPQQAELETILQECWEVFERKVKARSGSLSKDGRGIEEMRRKLRYSMKKWDTRIAEEAKKPKPGFKDWGEYRWGEEATAPSSVQATNIATVDFYTLLTEDVIEEPDYIEPAFAGPGNFVLIAGPPKAQKSFLLQEMLVACATGDKFLAGLFNVPRPLKVFYLQAEMNRKLLRKRAREFNFLSPEFKILLKSNLISSERFHMILNDDGVRVAVETIKSVFPKTPPDIIAIDPLANMFDGENENDNAQMMRFLAGRLEVIRRKVNPLACLVLVHHSTKKSVEDMARDPFVAIRGGGVIRSYYDSAIVLYRKSEEERTRRAHFELRSGESPEPIEIELVGGRFVRVAEGGLPSKEICRLILQRIDAAWRSAMPWSPYPRARSEGRYAIRNIVTEFGITAEAATYLIEQWLQSRVITFRALISRKRPAGFEVTGEID